MLESGKLAVGVNYWASHAATRMWRDWNAEVVERDFAALAAHGCRLVRVFPLWPDFQPLNMLQYCGQHGNRPREMTMGEEEKPLDPSPRGRAGLSQTMMERFRALCDLAEKHGLELIVALMTAHMTGRGYVPRAMENREIFTDPTALRWMALGIDRFVREMKDHPAIAAWSTGNELSFTASVANRDAAWVLTRYLHDAIRLADPARPVVGVTTPFISPDENPWLVQDQGELSDFTCVHKYDLRGPAAADGFCHLRQLMRAPAECRVNTDIGGKPCFIEETGNWRNAVTTLEGLGRAVRNMLWLAWADDCRGLMWWCAFDQENHEFAPYHWGDWPGLEHGVFSGRREAHPAAKALRDFAAFQKTLPFEKLPPPAQDAVCLVTTHEIASTSHILARQAGINLKFHWALEPLPEPLPEARTYFMPSVAQRGGVGSGDWRKLRERVAAGATLYLSVDDCNLPGLAELCGFEIEERLERPGTGVYHFDDFEFSLPAAYRRRLKTTSAKTLGRDGEDRPVFLVNEFGQGRVYTLLLPLEKLVFETPGAFDAPCFEVYRRVLPKERRVTPQSPTLLVSEHVFEDGAAAALVANCRAESLEEKPAFAPGWSGSGFLSDSGASFKDGVLSMPPNSGLLLFLARSNPPLPLGERVGVRGI